MLATKEETSYQESLTETNWSTLLIIAEELKSKWLKD